MDEDIAYHHPLHDDLEDVEMSDSLDHGQQDLDEEAVKRAGKKKRQWMKWNDEVIPDLLRPYVTLLAKTDNLWDTQYIQTGLGCTGCQLGRLIDIFCVFFDSSSLLFFFHFSDCLTIEIEKISLCTCNNIPAWLLSMALFPCAPIFPTLAVDIRLLEFVRVLFVNAAPNITAWCNTLEAFWDARGFKLSTRVNCQLLSDSYILIL